MKENSVDILHMYHTSMVANVVPVETNGDGNCLYRAVSQALTGSEKYHGFLRLKTALELIPNEKIYDKKNLIGDNRIITSENKVPWF